METIVIHPAYRKLGRRLNSFPQGAPSTNLLFKILEILFTPREAELVANLPLLPFDVTKAAGIWKMKKAEARKQLDLLARKGLLLDLQSKVHGKRYVLPPPIAGFFEMTLMRIHYHIDQKKLAEIYYQYINEEDEFAKALFLSGETSLGRVFVHEPALPKDCAYKILDYERASEVIRKSSCMAAGLCYCRQKMKHVGKACKAPMAICMTFNEPAAYLTRNGFARKVGVSEGLELLHQAYAHNLVQGGENVRDKVSFICNCCSCCCEALVAARRFDSPHVVETTNFIADLNRDGCKGCGKCVTVCPISALWMENAPKAGEGGGKPILEERLCLGCGLCAKNCPHGAIVLKPRSARVITPADVAYRTVLMAVERGVLQNLIFDKQALLSHRMMASILGAILKLSPIKQVLANKQLQSSYIDALIAWKGKIYDDTDPASDALFVGRES